MKGSIYNVIKAGFYDRGFRRPYFLQMGASNVRNIITIPIYSTGIVLFSHDYFVIS